MPPAQLATGFPRVAQKVVHLERAEIARVDLDQDPAGAPVVAVLFRALTAPEVAEHFIASGLGLALDVDGNGVKDPLTDGLLTLRYLFGFRGATLITGAVAGNCTRCTAVAIEAYLASL